MKYKGSFTVSSATNTVNMVLRFDMGSWFRNPLYRSLLDPMDTSSNTRQMMNKAIRMSFEKGRGGHDFNRDGRPDDDECRSNKMSFRNVRDCARWIESRSESGMPLLPYEQLVVGASETRKDGKLSASTRK
jgi:hypothetical protein